MALVLFPTIIGLLASCQVSSGNIEADATILRDSSPLPQTVVLGTVSLGDTVPTPPSPILLTASFVVFSAEEVMVLPTDLLDGPLSLGPSTGTKEESSLPAEFRIDGLGTTPVDGHIIAIADLDHSETLSSGDLYGFAPIAAASFESTGFYDYELTEIEVVLDRVISVE